jgi:beta-N-acetylhexosaminidase
MRFRRLPAAIGLLVLAVSLAPASSAASDPLANMTLREKVGQLVMFSLHGTSLTAEERSLIHKQHLGGVILFSQNYSNRAQLRALTDQVQKAVRSSNATPVGALVSADQEGGVVKRFPDMPPRYSAPELGARRTSLSYSEGRATGRALTANGVNVDLAPVADLDLPPQHVMRSRSFGTDPAKVGRRVRAFGRGLQSRHTAATAKHFPGLGGASVNSDDGHAYVRRSRWQLRHIDAVPFKKAIAGGLRMMMLSHGIFPHDGGKRPASVNHYIATKRLRHDLGFQGVAISDALDEVAWRFGGDTSRACVATIRAGVDIALLAGDAYEARSCAGAIRHAVKSGFIKESRLDEAVARVLDLKNWLGLLSP